MQNRTDYSWRGETSAQNHRLWEEPRRALLNKSGAQVGRKGSHGGIRGMKVDHRGGKEK